MALSCGATSAQTWSLGRSKLHQELRGAIPVAWPECIVEPLELHPFSFSHISYVYGWKEVLWSPVHLFCIAQAFLCALRVLCWLISALLKLTFILRDQSQDLMELMIWLLFKDIPCCNLSPPTFIPSLFDHVEYETGVSSGRRSVILAGDFCPFPNKSG